MTWFPLLLIATLLELADTSQNYNRYHNMRQYAHLYFWLPITDPYDWLNSTRKERRDRKRMSTNEHILHTLYHAHMCSLSSVTPLPSHIHTGTQPSPLSQGPYSHTPAIIPWYILQLHAPPADVRAPPTCSNFAMVWLKMPDRAAPYRKEGDEKIRKK